MKRVKKIFFAAFFVFIILAGALFYLQDRISGPVRTFAVGELSKGLNTRLNIDSLKVNIYQGLVLFTGLSIENPPGCRDKYFLEIERGFIAIDLLRLLFGRLEIRKIRIDRPRVNIEINKDSASNMKLVFKPKPRSDQPGPPSARRASNKEPFKISDLEILDGAYKLTNYKVNPSGAQVLFDQINIRAGNLTDKARNGELPTSIRCAARLPAEDLTGRVEFSGKGLFFSGLLDFDLDLNAKDISLVYFTPFFINSAAVLTKKGYFDLSSAGRCRKNEITARQRVDIKDLEIAANSNIADNNLVFGIPVLNLINLVVNNQGGLSFDFDITGTIERPRFHIGEALQKAVTKSVGNAILGAITKIPDKIYNTAGEAKDIEDAGKEVLKNIFKQIINTKQEEHKEEPDQGGQ